MDSVSKMFQTQQNLSKKKVLACLSKNNPDISKFEVEEICGYLEEASSPPQSRTFYQQWIFKKFLNNGLIFFPIKSFLIFYLNVFIQYAVFSYIIFLEL